MENDPTRCGTHVLPDVYGCFTWKMTLLAVAPTSYPKTKERGKKTRRIDGPGEGYTQLGLLPRATLTQINKTLCRAFESFV
jgi:hypothetical protein